MTDQPITVITGGASGIGYATAELLLQRGHRLALLDISEERGRAAAQALGEAVVGVACDVTSPESLAEAVAAIESRLGRPSGLVCCAGMAQKPGSISDLSEDDFANVFNSHVKGTLLTCRTFAPMMLARGGGAIVNLASVVAHAPGPTFAYAPAKAAVLNMTRSMAAEWGRKGVRVNSVSPGWTETPFLTQRSTREAPRNLDQLGRAMLLGRLLHPREIASACAFLLSDEASGIIGADIVVDGGFLAGHGYTPYAEANHGS